MSESAIGPGNKFQVETLASVFSFPHGIAIHRDGTIYITDQNRNRLIKLQKNNQEYSAVEVNPVHNSHFMKLDFPGGVLFDKEGRLFVADTTHKTIKIIDLQQNIVIREIGPSIPKENSSQLYYLEQPRSIAFDNNGHLLVVNCGQQKIAKIDVTTGKCIAEGCLSKNCALPQGIAVDRNNNILFANRNQHTIHIMDSTTLTELGVLAGTGTEAHVDGSLHEACFTSPCGITLDARGNIYVSDYKAIRKIDRNKDQVSTIVTGLDFPLCMTFDSQGNMIFTEYVGHAVKKIILNQRMPWRFERLLWIGFIKNSREWCPLAGLPKEMVKEIVSFCSGTTW